MPLASGTALGPYQVVAFVGAGGMGEIYKARDTRLDRTVALKILPQTNDLDRRQRFEREARAISQLQHPHICTLFDVGNQDGVEYLVMEYLEGQTLAQRLEKGPLPLSDLLQFAAEIAHALDHAHRAAICHRDLKPANIMLTKTAGVKLMDFGLARALSGDTAPIGGETATMALTREGVILGTLPYMSPEQLEGKPGDVRSDIFAFGAVLYEMATGRRAFAGESGASLITQIMSADPPSMREVQPVTPVALERIVRRCLVKAPEQRWQNAHDIGAALECVTDDSIATPEPRQRVQRRRIAAGLILAMLIAVAAALATYSFPRAPEPSIVTLTVPPPPDGAFSGLGVPTASPDGNYIAFVATTARVARVWIRSLGSLQARPVAGTEGARSVFWSPDGKSIAFDGGGKLKRIPAEGGVAQTICDVSNMRGATWSQDGTIVFAPNVQTTLYRVAASGGEAVSVTALDTSKNENSHRWPQFLPDGKRFLYFARSAILGESGIYADSVDSAKRPDRKMILKTESNALYVPPPEGVRGSGRLVYVRDRTLLAQQFDADRLQFAGEPNVIAEQVAESTPIAPAQFFATPRLLTYGGRGGASYQLTWFDRSGKRLSEITKDDGSYARPELSPDGKRISASAIRAQTNIIDLFIVDVVRNVSTRFTFGGTLTRSSIWSPDGRFVAYTALVKGKAALVKKQFDGSGAEEVISDKASVSSVCDWSHDGKWILYTVPGEHTQSDLWYLPAAGGGEPKPFLATKALEICGQFSPDGNWVAYTSDESGSYQVYVQAFPTGAKWQISRDGGVQARWKGDGKELFFHSPDGGVMMAADIRAGAAIESGIPVKLFPTSVTPAEGGLNYSVTRDGQKFVIPTEGHSGVAEPITAVLNWSSLLKK
jgi:Tol biopolymer transport system component